LAHSGLRYIQQRRSERKQIYEVVFAI